MVDNKIRVAINPNYADKNVSNWLDLNNTFDTIEVEPASFIERVAIRGHPWTAPHYKRSINGGAHRNRDNFIQSELIGIDFDDNHYNDIAALPFFRQYGWFIHTTPSHTIENPRCRAIFRLETPIKDPIKYTKTVLAVHEAIGAEADSKCSDPARLFFGSREAIIVMNNKKLPLGAITLPDDNIKERPAFTFKFNAEQAEQYSAYVKAAFKREVEDYASTIQGNRHDRLLQAAIKIGSILKSPWSPSWLTPSMVESALINASQRNGYWDDDGEYIVKRTIQDGILYAEPRPVPPDFIENNDSEASNIASAYIAGYHAGKDDARKMMEQLDIPPFGSRWRIRFDPESNSIIIPFWGHGWMLNDVLTENTEHRDFLIGKAPLFIAEPSNQTDTAIILGDVSSAMYTWANIAMVAEHFIDSEPDIIVAPFVPDNKYPTALLKYTNKFLLSYDGFPTSLSQARKLGANYLQLQDRPSKLFGRYQIKPHTFFSMLEQSW